MNLEPIRELVKTHKAIQRHKEMDDAYFDLKAKLADAVDAAVPTLSQLLEAVTNLEKLEQKWRDEAAMCETLSVSFTTKREQSFIANCARDCADELKRALHPEDK